MAAADTSSVRGAIERLLRIDAQDKPRVYARVFESAEVADLNYWLELLFSAGIATLGLVLNSVAVIIGAMLISPLMGPIIAAGLALAAADLYLGLKSVLNLLASIAAAVAFSSFLVWLLPFQAATQEIISRTQPNLLDLGVAVFSGLAGSVVVCRGGGGGGVTALPGVAIAVALMPPLCTVGFGVGSGLQRGIINGAGLLFLTNLAAIVTSAFIVFFIVRMDSPDVRGQIDRSILDRAASDRLYQLLCNTWLGRSFGDIGTLRWRLLMPLVVLAVLFVPLGKSLLQLRDEANARAAVREALREVAPREMVVTQQLDLGASRIRVGVVVAGTVDDGKVASARRAIAARTGKQVELTVRRVAGEEELAALREELRPPPAAPAEPQPAPPTNPEAVRFELLARVEPALRSLWPADSALIQDFELALRGNGLLLRVHYESARPLDQATTEALLRGLRTQLNWPALKLELVRQRAARRR